MIIYSFFHKAVFSSISLIYSLFFKRNSRRYLEIIEANKQLLGDPSKIKVLDLGCGTGTFTWAFNKAGYNVIGSDISQAMMLTARAHGLNCVSADILSGVPFEDKSFDLVCAAYVAHGMRRKYRMKLYKEAGRLSSGTVLFHDYNKQLPALPALIIEIIELLIGSDFFGFRKNGLNEMRTYFKEVTEYKVARSNSWYICRS